MSRLFVIGDIHGYCNAFTSLTEWVGLESEDTLITLGDYISGGPNSKGVIDELLRLKTEVHLIPLLGNHELLMLSATNNQDFYKNWLLNGGAGILSSYRTSSIDDLPALHWSFLRSCQRYHEEEELIFVHGTVDPDLPMEEQSNSKLFWEKLTGNIPHCSGKTVICGHTPQISGTPLQLENTICIDTNIKKGGWTTCLEPATGRYWQMNEAGLRRNGVLLPLRVEIP